MSPIGVWCHLGAQEQACRRSKCVNSVLVSSASSHEVCVREPRAALCPASRRGRASPVGAAPPHHARTRQPSLPSRPARANARPAPVHPSIPPAGARPVVAWRRGPLARGQHHGTADSRVPACPGASRRSVPAPPRHCSSSAPRAAGGACVHGNGLPAGGQVSAVYSLSKSRARPQLGPGAGEGLASATLARESSVESEYGPCVWIDYCCAGYMCVVLCSLQAPMTGQRLFFGRLFFGERHA